MDYSKIYIGTVIRSSDTVVAKNGKASSPQGRVLVKIEGISQTNKHNEDYKFPLGKICETKNNCHELEELKQILIPVKD